MQGHNNGECVSCVVMNEGRPSVSSNKGNSQRFARFFLSRQALSELQGGGAQTVETAETAQAVRSENETLRTRLDQVTQGWLNDIPSIRLGGFSATRRGGGGGRAGVLRYG